ncbi:MAG TPA: hypothetical protein VNP73_01540, partial [Actinomycetota bacterium]|nr:hypothetical protein [Actinomycetota bacterium]
LEGDRILRMQSHSEMVISSTRSIRPTRGNILIDAGEPTRATFDGVTASAREASFRVDRGFGTVRTGAYEGQVELASPGQSPLTVSRLFEATVAAGDLPGKSDPYRVNEKDPWDLDRLQDVVELEEELGLLAKGFSRLVGNNKPNLAYFNALADGPGVSFMRPYLKRRPVDLLIGFTIANNDRDHGLAGAFKDAFGFYDRGATWGVTAAIMEVSARPVVAQLEDVILSTGVVAADGSGEEAVFSVASAEAADGGPAPSGPRGDAGQDPGGNDDRPAGLGDDEGDDGNDGGDDDDGGEEECDPTDVGCQAGRVIPSPSPTDDPEEEEEEDEGLLTGVVEDD